jgi:SAM-dependent methyltransferase
MARGLPARQALLDSAALARVAAPILCPSGREGCAWYHGIYPSLRALGLAATPDRHGDFYAGALAALAAERPRARVLLTGSADWGMLAHVLRAWRGGRPRIVVLDMCETPLLLCRWWARRAGATIETRAADFARFRPDEPYDIILCHSFLAKFMPAGRAHAVARWRACLRPGGRVVSVQRLGPDQSAASVGFSEAAARAFPRNVVRVARELPALAPRASELGRAAAIYARRIRSWPLASADEVRALFHHGFELERLDVVERPGAPATVAGAGLARRARYAEFVARRG